MFVSLQGLEQQSDRDAVQQHFCQLGETVDAHNKLQQVAMRTKGLLARTEVAQDSVSLTTKLLTPM